MIDDPINDQLRGLLAHGTPCPLCGGTQMHEHSEMEVRCYRSGCDYGQSLGRPPSQPVAPASRTTTDRNDPRLVRSNDDAPRPQADVYLVLSEDERARGFVRPVRDSYLHRTCGAVTTMGRALAETYARDPKFYGGTYCCTCAMHRPVAEFTWEPDGSEVGS